MSKLQLILDRLSASVQGLQKKLSKKPAVKSGSVRQNPDEEYIKLVKSGERVGVYFDFFTWNLIIRPIVSLLAGLLALVGFSLASMIIIGSNVVDAWLGAGLVLLFAYLVGMSEKEVEVVPEGRMAMVTWFGIQFRFYRMTGEYTWTGKKFRLGRTNAIKEPMTDKEGFFFTDVVQVNIWNAYEADASKRSNILVALTKTGGDIKANLLLMLSMRDPMLWITKTDPMMDIGERARMSFRTAVSFFTGKDVVSVKNLLTELMSGHVVLTCFLKEAVETLVKHSLIRDSGGDPIYESVRPGEDIEAEKVKFLEALKSADKDLLAHVHTDDKSVPVVEVREVSESLDEVLHACGITLVRASIGFIALPDEVVKAANQADAQPYQLKTQLASAQATKRAREILAPTPEELADPTFTDRQAIAASSDPDSRIEVIHVSGGGGGLGKAAAIVANGIKKGSNK